MKILITGATGFIGQALSRTLLDSGFDLRVAVRRKDNKLLVDCEKTAVGDIGTETDWRTAVAGIDTVIHLAGRARVKGDPAPNPLDAFRIVNVLGTEQLARMAAKAGVKRFIFISSVKVNGEGASRPYTENDPPAPRDAYAISKMEAERILTHVASDTGLQTVVLRLPSVYGPEAKANFRSLIKISTLGLPLPFRGISNRRSFIFVGNLVDAIIKCITHASAAGETFMVSDGQDVSTPELIEMIASAMNKKPVLFSLHPGILKALCKVAGKTEEAEKLTGSLLVDSSKIRNLLGWKPPFTVEEGIKETVKHYKP